MGIGTMLTSSVSVVQSSFPDRDQGDISGLSRSFSNLGSSLGTALVGPVLVAAKLPAGPAIRRCPDHDSRDCADRSAQRHANPSPARTDQPRNDQLQVLIRPLEGMECTAPDCDEQIAVP